MKSVFTIEPYYESGNRCLGCYMDDCGSCSCDCHNPVIRFAIKYKKKVIESGFRTHEDAIQYRKNKLNVKSIKQDFKEMMIRLKNDIAQLKRELAEVCKEEQAELKKFKSYK